MQPLTTEEHDGTDDVEQADVNIMLQLVRSCRGLLHAKWKVRVLGVLLLGPWCSLGPMVV